jgi:hypothetical protein
MGRMILRKLLGISSIFLFIFSNEYMKIENSSENTNLHYIQIQIAQNQQRLEDACLIYQQNT